MKILENEHKFTFSWGRISQANWIKYPNEFTPHVTALDYLERRLDVGTGVLHTTRLLTCTQQIPDALLRLFFSKEDIPHSYVKEISQVDARKGALDLRAKNLTLCDLLSVREHCSYLQIDEENTLFKQRIWIEAGERMWHWLRETAEEFCARTIQANASKGKVALEHALEKINRAQQN